MTMLDASHTWLPEQVAACAFGLLHFFLADPASPSRRRSLTQTHPGDVASSHAWASCLLACQQAA